MKSKRRYWASISKEKRRANCAAGFICPRSSVLVRPDEIVRIYDSAVIKSAVRACGTDQDTVVGKIDAQRCAPWIHEFAFVIQVGFAAPDDHDHVLGVGSLEGLRYFEIAARGIGTDAFFIFLQGGKKVFISDKGMAKEVMIQTGARTAKDVLVLTGLKAGDTILTTGLLTLKNETPVKAIVTNKKK